MKTPRILMCPPDYYGIEYEINPWMSRARGADVERTHRQWSTLRDTLVRLGVQVELMTPERGLPEPFSASRGFWYFGQPPKATDTVLFVGYDPAVQPLWAGFWRLDDHRGKDAVRSIEEALNAPEIFTIIAGCRGITTVPASQAAMIQRLLRGVVVIPLADARPAVLGLIWHGRNHNPLVHSLATAARRLANPNGKPPTEAVDPAEVGFEEALENLNSRLAQRRRSASFELRAAP